MRFFAVLLLLAFIAVAIRLRAYCVTTCRVRLRLFVGAWFLVLSGLLLRGAWIGLTRHSHDIGEAMAKLDLGLLSGGVGVVSGALGLAYFAPTIRALLQRRRLPSSPDESPAANAPLRWPEAWLPALVVLPLLGVTWLTLTLFFPAAIAFPKSDHPLPWLKATTSPASADATGRVITWGETTLSTQSSAGQWNPIPFGDQSSSLAILSPDAVLITEPTPMPPGLISGDVYNLFVGAVYRKGTAAPVVTIPRSDDIAPVPSGGFNATRCEPAPRCQDHSCRGCSYLTVERFDSLGTLTSSATFPVPLDAEECDWWPVHRLMGDDFVYSVYWCRGDSKGGGYYRATPSGVQRITSLHSGDQYTAVEDKKQLESQTQSPNQYHIPWIHDPR